MDCVICCRFLWIAFCVVNSCGLCCVVGYPVECVMCCKFLWIVMCCRLSCGLCYVL